MCLCVSEQLLGVTSCLPRSSNQIMLICSAILSFCTCLLEINATIKTYSVGSPHVVVPNDPLLLLA